MLNSLKSRLLIFLVGFIIFAVLLQVVSSVFVFREEMISAENEKIVNYIHFVTPNFVEAYEKYYETDFWAFQEATKKLKQTFPIIDNVQMVDLKGNVLFDIRNKTRKEFQTLAEGERDAMPFLSGTATKFIYQDGEDGGLIQTVVYPILEEGGFREKALIYRISYKPIMEQVLGSTFKTFSFILPVMLFLFLVSLFIVFRILKPISDLGEGVREINEGDLDHQLEIMGGGELSEIAVGFNKMTQEYKYAMIKSQRVDVLERELKARKKELEKQFDDLQDKSSEIIEFKKALLNLSEDANKAKNLAINERDKTLAIINSFADGILLFDEKNQITLVNPKFEKYFEISAKELLNKNISDLGNIEKVNVIRGVLSGDISNVYRRELHVKDDLILEISIISVSSGKLVIFHNVTREKMIEKTKSEFVSIAAHQLRTPLSAIKWIFGMMSDGEWGEVPKEQKEYLQKGYVSTERLIRVVNDLLNVSRIEEGKFISKFAEVNVKELLENTIAQYQGLSEQKQITLKLEMQDGLPVIHVDPDTFKIGLENLIENAINYTPEKGTVIVRASLDEGNMIKIEVKDSGIGIPKAQQARIFGKFFRGQNALKKETSGSGLGLFVTRNIVETHGGKIWFESEENNGTSFFFTIPTEKREKDSVYK